MKEGHSGISRPATNAYVHGIDARPNTTASDQVSSQPLTRSASDVVLYWYMTVAGGV